MIPILKFRLLKMVDMVARVRCNQGRRIERLYTSDGEMSVRHCSHLFWCGAGDVLRRRHSEVIPAKVPAQSHRSPFPASHDRRCLSTKQMSPLQVSCAFTLCEEVIT